MVLERNIKNVECPIRRVLGWMDSVADTPQEPAETMSHDIFPCVAYNGDVVLLSPEFLLSETGSYRTFAVGNVLRESLKQIINRGKNSTYVSDFTEGVRECAVTCDYFDCCRGGQASNKFFELGTTKGTETTYCKNSEQRLVRAILNNI